MTPYEQRSATELTAERDELEHKYVAYRAMNLSLNMARGKPSAAQLDLSMPMLDILSSRSECRSADGTDCRTYGMVDGVFEAKRLMANMLDDNAKNVIVFGNSSLSIMYDTVARCFAFGSLGSTPWSHLDQVKWICPVPGYDRHFTITETFGADMICVPMKKDGPDMDEVEHIAASDERVKGMWCVPKYSNPNGITYSDEVVQRLASMKCAANDFRIFWDNAYSVHHLFDDPNKQDHLLDIGEACCEAGNPHRYFKFASTSKVTFPGAGIAAFAASPEIIAETKKYLACQTIGYDKLNELRHVRFLRDAAGIETHMTKHAAILRPKFTLVTQKLTAGLSNEGIGSWSSPRGGYFVSFDAPEGTAKRIVELARQAGVTLTEAGATYPYKNDPHDSNIRLAPTMPTLEELAAAMDIFICCVKLATIEKLLAIPSFKADKSI